MFYNLFECYFIEDGLIKLQAFVTTEEIIQYPQRVLTTRADPGPFNCTTSGIVCSDCFTQAVCTLGAGSQPVLYQPCSPARPYCSSFGCSASQTDSSAACQSTIGNAVDFECTSQGRFPHPLDCNKSYYCPAASAKAELMACANNLVYNARDGTCRSRFFQMCSKIDCSRRPNNAVVTFPLNPAYYAVCSAGPPAKTVLFKCADELNEVYDPSIGACRYNCLLFGNYADRTNCNGYINCSWQGRWVATKQLCAPNQMFRAGRCVTTSTPCVSQIRV